MKKYKPVIEASEVPTVNKHIMQTYITRFNGIAVVEQRLKGSKQSLSITLLALSKEAVTNRKAANNDCNR